MPMKPPCFLTTGIYVCLTVPCYHKEFRFSINTYWWRGEIKTEKQCTHDTSKSTMPKNMVKAIDAFPRKHIYAPTHILYLSTQYGLHRPQIKDLYFKERQPYSCDQVPLKLKETWQATFLFISRERGRFRWKGLLRENLQNTTPLYPSFLMWHWLCAGCSNSNPDSTTF